MTDINPRAAQRADARVGIASDDGRGWEQDDRVQAGWNGRDGIPPDDSHVQARSGPKRPVPAVR